MKLTPQQLTQTSAELSEIFKYWKLFENQREFFVFRLPSPGGDPSPLEGETIPVWRFDTRFAAERFRNLKVIRELTVFKEQEPA